MTIYLSTCAENMHWLANGLEPFLILHTCGLKLTCTASPTGLLSDELGQL